MTRGDREEVKLVKKFNSVYMPTVDERLIKATGDTRNFYIFLSSFSLFFF